MTNDERKKYSPRMTHRELIKQIDECNNPVTYSSLKGIAVSRFKELTTENEQLEERIESLEKRIEELEYWGKYLVKEFEDDWVQANVSIDTKNAADNFKSLIEK